jgi:RNA recognition motif-containing protein
MSVCTLHIQLHPDTFYTFFSFGVIVLSKNIYVGNLAWAVSDDELRSMFEQFGEVTSARVIEDRETGRSRGFGFVEMDDEGAQQAIQALNGADSHGRNLKVNEAQPRTSRPRY